MSDKPFRVGRSKTGLGLFATALIEKGAFIVEYQGRRLSNKEAEAIERKGGNRYMMEINSRWTIDGASRRNIARYVNHSCRPNAEFVAIRGKAKLFAIKRIRPNEEITCNYGREYFDLFIKPIGCKCAKCAKKDQRRRSSRTKRNGGPA